MSTPAHIIKFLAARNEFKQKVYDEIIIETDKLFEGNPQMTKLRNKIKRRVKAMEDYDAAAILALSEYYPEIIRLVGGDGANNESISLDNMKNHYEQ